MKYSVIRYWEVRDEVKVEADCPEDAVFKAHNLDLSSNPEYVVDSMNTDSEVDVQEIG